MVKHAREMIKRGDLGEIRFVNAEYPQDWLATPLETSGQKQAAWRTDPAQTGKSNCVGDIGSHVENMASYMTGLKIKSLCARLDTFVPGRILDDNASIMVNYENGAKGLYWSSQVAVGNDNGLRLRIYGTKGAAEWFQETPNTARVSLLDRPTETISRGRDPMSPRAQGLSRLPSGHPEGVFRRLRQRLRDFHHSPFQEAPRRAARPRRPRFPQRRRRRPRRPLHRGVRRELGQRRGLGGDGLRTRSSGTSLTGPGRGMLRGDDDEQTRACPAGLLRSGLLIYSLLTSPGCRREKTFVAEIRDGVRYVHNIKPASERLVAGLAFVGKIGESESTDPDRQFVSPMSADEDAAGEPLHP